MGGKFGIEFAGDGFTISEKNTGIFNIFLKFRRDRPFFGVFVL